MYNRVRHTLNATTDTRSLENRRMLDQTLVADFNDGTSGDFEMHQSASDPWRDFTFQNGALTTEWFEEHYNGNNAERKAEFRTPLNTDTWDADFKATDDIWVGFRVRLRHDYMTETTSNAGLMQIWGIDRGDDGVRNWVGLLQYESIGDGRLVFQNRSLGSGNSSINRHLVTEDFDRGEWHDVVVHATPSKSNEGTIEIWIDGDKQLDLDNQNFGSGDIVNNEFTDDSFLHATIGQYNFNHHGGDWELNGQSYSLDAYAPGERRVVYYDNPTVSNTSSPNGFYYVDPARYENEIAYTE